MKIDWDKLEEEVMESFLDKNIVDSSNHELVKMIAEISSRISVIAISKAFIKVAQSQSEQHKD